MRIYIAGPMTGLPGYNYPAFRAAAAGFRIAGMEVVSPVELGEKYGTPDDIAADPAKLADLLIEELDAIPNCDLIALLPGWERSHGAKKELAVALAHKLGIIVLPEGVKDDR